VNGTKMGEDGWRTKEAFEKVITDALKAAGVTPKPVDANPVQPSGGNE
jgi:hypothetical protein